MQELICALKGQLTTTQADKLSIALDNYRNFNEKIGKLDALIEEKSLPYKKEIDLICSCFAIKKTSAITIISEIGTDMSHFPSQNHLCSWAGLCPENNETGGRRRPARTKRGNRYLKAILTQCVNFLSRSKKNSRFVNRLNSIKMRRGHNKAVIAVCRSMLISIYNMLKKNEPFKETTEPIVSSPKAQTFSKISDDILIQELTKRGYKLDVLT